MNALKNLNAAIDYIEENLCTDISLAKAAQLAGCSEFQLLRMFPYIAGITLGEYVRRRRMSLAASDLVASDAKIIDISAKYGYESATAFTRAFRNVHGASPSAVRSGAASIVVCPRMLFVLTTKGAEHMNYRIEKLPELRVVGVAQTGVNWDDNVSEQVAQFWMHLGSGVHRILDLMDGSKPHGLLGVSFGDGHDGIGQYMAAVATDAPCPDGMTEHTIPAATYAVFECKGAMPDAMSQLWHRILAEWLPSSGYEWDGVGDIERYMTPNMTSPDAESEVWIPVRAGK